MMFLITVSLLLVILLIQVHGSSNNYCAASIKNTVTAVSSCPTSKEMWELAASKKHCEKHALQQNCTQAFSFIYHCLINHYKNETLEVCAQERLIFGHCAEFNVAGGVIQSHYLAPCNQSTSPRCDEFYFSSEGYKYPDCYKLVLNQRLDNTTSSAAELDRLVIMLISSACTAVFFASICAVVLFIYRKKRRLSNGLYVSKKSVPFTIYQKNIDLQSSPAERHSFSVLEPRNPYISRHLQSSSTERHSSFLLEPRKPYISRPITSNGEDFSEDDASEYSSIYNTEIEENNPNRHRIPAESHSSFWLKPWMPFQTSTITSNGEDFSEDDASEKSSIYNTEIEENNPSM